MTGGPLVCISSPFGKHGVMWDAFKRDYGPEGDPLVLVAQSDSRTMNPLLPQSRVDREYARDPIIAAAE